MCRCVSNRDPSSHTALIPRDSRQRYGCDIEDLRAKAKVNSDSVCRAFSPLVNLRPCPSTYVLRSRVKPDGDFLDPAGGVPDGSGRSRAELFFVFSEKFAWDRRCLSMSTPPPRDPVFFWEHEYFGLFPPFFLLLASCPGGGCAVGWALCNHSPPLGAKVSRWPVGEFQGLHFCLLLRFGTGNTTHGSHIFNFFIAFLDPFHPIHPVLNLTPLLHLWTP